MKNEEHKDKEKKSESRKKAATAAVAVTASAGLLIGGLFGTPDALLTEEEPLAGPVCSDDAEPGPGDDAEEELEETDGGEEEDEQQAGTGVRARLRQKILQLPLALRLLVALPLWALGWLLQTGATALWSLLLGPVLGKALGWLLLIAALVGAFLLAAKTVFPDLPLKKILNRRSLSALAIGALALGVADCVLPLCWDGYARIEAWVRAIGIGAVFAAVTVSFAVREQRRRRVLPDAEIADADVAEEEESEPAPLTREEILAIADSVSRPR